MLIGLIVIFILLLCLGANIGFIASIALLLVALFIVFMTCFFVYTIILLITGKKVKGVYTHSEKDSKSNIPFAYYMINDVEYKNALPLEVVFQNKIYRPDREVNLILNQKRNKCFDNNALICCIMGVIISVFLFVEILILFFGNINLL